jgi:hypothetical protein
MPDKTDKKLKICKKTSKKCGKPNKKQINKVSFSGNKEQKSGKIRKK